MIIAVPGRLDFLGPQALQVGGQTAGPGGADQKIPPVLIIERQERGIVAALFEGHQAAVDGQSGGRLAGGLAIVQAQADAFEIMLIIRHVRPVEVVPGGLRGRFHIPQAGGGGVGGLPAGEPVKIRGGGDEEQHFIRVIDAQLVLLGDADFAPLGHHPRARGVLHARPVMAIVQLARHEQFPVAGTLRFEPFRAIERNRKRKRPGAAAGQAGHHRLPRRANQGLALE